MIWVDKKLVVDFHFHRDKATRPHTIEKMREKSYTVSDTNLSHRQINSLASSKMLPENRDKEMQWRKFSFIELVYLRVVKECRDYGLLNEQLNQLYESFFSPNLEISEFTDAEQCIELALGSIGIKLLIGKNGKCDFTDDAYKSFLQRDAISHVTIQFNNLVLEVLETALKAKGNKLPPYTDYRSLVNSNATILSKNEKEIIDIIRNYKYSRITLKKQTGSYVLNAEHQNADASVSDSEFLEMMKQKDFTNIEIVKRDGKIVNYKFLDVYKI